MKKRSSSMAGSRGRLGISSIRRSKRPIASRSRTSSAKRASGTGTRSRSRKSAPASAAGGRKSSKMTTNHDQIRRWVESRGGHPATVKRTARKNEQAGIIRIDFPGYSGAQSLKPISWDEWFNTFEERKLALLYQDRTAAGKPSRFNKLVSRKD